MVGVDVKSRSSISFRLESSCGALFRELQCIWAEIGESEADKDRLLLEVERECLEVYQRRVNEASDAKARLRQTLASKEAELAVLMASLGEHNLHSETDRRPASLKEQLASVTPLLDNLRAKKEGRIKQFADIRSQIEKISIEMTEYMYQNGVDTYRVTSEENDFSLRKLNEYQQQLRALQKEKSDRLNKVLEYVNEVHSLCGVLGLDFSKTVDDVHPTLHENGSEQSTNISNTTLEGLSRTVAKLKSKKKARIYKLQETLESLFELWNLMDSSEEERSRFAKLTHVFGSSEHDITYSGFLSLENIKQTEVEVERLKKIKASRMKELVLKRRLELEEICRRAHTEPDISTAREKINALIDSGLVDPSELLANIDMQIVKAKEESISRIDILDRISKWLTACEEENWLDHYNQDGNRYSAGRGGHINLKRAEKARVTVTKIPAIVNNLISRTFSWEDERNAPFLYDGVRLVAILEEYKLTKQQKEEEKKRYRDQKKLHGLLIPVKEGMHGSRSIPKRSTSFNSKANGYHSVNGNNGFMAPMPRRISVGSATPELLTPRSYSGHHNGYFRETRRLSTGQLNFVSLPKEDTSSSFASISGSEPESPTLF